MIFASKMLWKTTYCYIDLFMKTNDFYFKKQNCFLIVRPASFIERSCCFSVKLLCQILTSSSSKNSHLTRIIGFGLNSFRICLTLDTFKSELWLLDSVSPAFTEGWKWVGQLVKNLFEVRNYQFVICSDPMEQNWDLSSQLLIQNVIL